MANNEDYLDSLLKAAEAEDNPDSAINKVKELSKKQEEERLKEEKEKADSNIDDLLKSLAGEEESEIGTEDLAMEDLSEISAPLEEIIIEESPIVEEVPIVEEMPITEEVPATEEIPAVEEMLITEDIPVVEEMLITEDIPVVEEMPITEDIPMVEEMPMTEDVPIVEDLPVTEDLSVVDETPADDGAPISEDATASGEPSDDIEALLKSGFEGELEVDEDVASLLENAEKFATEDPIETVAEESPEGADSEENEEEFAASSDIGLEPEVKEEEFNIDDMMNLISEEGTEETASADDPLGGMSEEELNAALDEASADKSQSTEEMEIDLSDLESLESELGIHDKVEDDGMLESGGVSGVDGLEDLSDLLASVEGVDGNLEGGEFNSTETADIGDIDMLDLLNDAVSKQEAIEDEEEQVRKAAKKAKEEAEAEKEAAKKSKKHFGKKKKAEEGEEILEKPKKETFFTKLLAFLTAEDGDSEDLLIPQDSEGGFEDVPGENKEILDSIDAEEAENKKGKKRKKKGKKGKEEPKKDDEEGEDEESEDSASKKKKKEPKEKKERKPLVLDIDTGKPLSKKNVILIFIMCFTLMLAIILVVKLVPAIITNASARKAYYKGDYETTYQTFFGEKLSDSDQILFERSAVILKMAHKYEAYNAYMNMNKRTEALDQLLQGVDNYENWLYLAAMSGCEAELNQEYAKVTGALLSTFKIDEAEAKTINAMETDLEYSLMVESIANGTRYIDPNTPLPGVFVPPTEEDNIEVQYEDVLPEEGN